MAPADEPRRLGILKNDSVENSLGPNVAGALQSTSPRSTPKSVSIAPKGELISPLILGGTKDVDTLDLDDDRSSRRARVKSFTSRHRLTGRPRHQSSISSLQQWLDDATENDTESGTSHADHHLFNSGLVGQLAQWIRDEKIKRDARRARRKARHADTSIEATTSADDAAQPRQRRDSDDSVDLDTLEQIIKESAPFGRRMQQRLSVSGRSRASTKKSYRTASVGASTDTEFVDGDYLVPSAEVVLDNSCALSYKGGAAKSSADLELTREPTAAEDAWLKFKWEVLRLIHTLRLKGWRNVPLDMSPEVSIDRLSGALTNAVYVVSPPEELPLPAPHEKEDGAASQPRPRRKPPKLLLRIYGPQVEHLIDREAELQILCRLARKHIGPRMLGTFINGRFEEFLNAVPLTPDELRNPDTSRHIAKRMRELHDGIDLLASERQAGPFVWQNWDKWLARVQKIAEWLDSQTPDQHGADGTLGGLVCGTRWATFHDTVFKYRKWLEKELGGSQKLLRALVFAHNDAQYGNILRVVPCETSPLLLPANSHKQLVVIDFEYSNANTVGLEFANHFTEWTYNYHDATAPWRCAHQLYPKPDEQERFIRAYTRHRPDFNITTPQLGPVDDRPETKTTNPSSDASSTSVPDDHPDSHIPTSSSGQSHLAHRPKGPSHSISNLMLDARNPNATSTISSSGPSPGTDSDAGGDYAQKEDARVKTLLHETRLWRMANSAQWVAWGIVQAKIPGMPDLDDLPEKTSAASKAETTVDDADLPGKPRWPGPDSEEERHLKREIEEEEKEEEEEAEFDYLAYARDRAMFFWGDAVALGFVKLDELPPDVQRDIKRLDY